MPNFSNDELNHKFGGTVASLSDILPCPACKSLKCKSAPSINCSPYETRYQCRKCGTFFRFDHRPPEETHESIMARENNKSKLVYPAGTQPGPQE